MTTETDAALAAARRYVDSYNKCTAEFVDACVTDDFSGVFFPGGEVVGPGREALREALSWSP